MTMRVRLTLSGLFLFFLVSCNGLSSLFFSEMDPLASWLYRQELQLPNQSFSAGILHIKVENLVCSQFILSNVTSRHENLQLRLQIDNLGATCTGNYASTGLKGHVHALVQGTDLKVNFDVIPSINQTITKPIGWRTESVDASHLVATVHLDGSASARIINTFAKTIGQYISETLQKQIPSLLQSKLDPLLTRYIQRATNWLAPYVNQTGSRHSEVTELENGRMLSNEQGQLHLQTSEWQPSALKDFLTTVNGLSDQYLNQGWLAQWIPELETCGGTAAGINGLLKNLDGKEIPIPSFHWFVHGVKVEVGRKLVLSKVDAWEVLQVASPSAGNTYQTSLQTPRLQVQIQIGVSKDDFHEELTTQVDLSHVNISALLQPEWNSTVINEISLHSIAKCFWHLWNDLTFLSLNVDMNWTNLTIQSVDEEGLEGDLDGVVHHVVNLVLESFPDYVTRALSGLTQGPALDRLNTWLKGQINPQQCVETENTLPQLVDFTSISIWEQFQSLLRRPETLNSLNSYAQCSANAVTSKAQQMMALQDIPIEVALTHAGSLREFEVLNPLSEDRLWSQIMYSSPEKPELKLTIRAPKSTWNVSLVANDINWASGVILRYNLREWGSLKVFQALDRSMCWLVPTNDVDFFNVTGSLSTMLVTVNGTKEDKALQLRYPLAEMSSSLLEWAALSVRDGIKLASTGILDNALAVCEGRPSGEGSGDDDEDSFSNYTSILIVVAGCFVLSQPLILLLRPTSNRSSTSVPNESALEEPLIPQVVEDAEDMQIIPDDSLMSQAPASEFLKVCIPMFILGTMGLLLASNLSVGATVSISLSSGDRVWDFPPLFEFSLANTIRDMWNARIYPLFFLVVVFSGIWPYVKLGLMLFAWLTPQVSLSVTARSRLLYKLDAYGKFSLVDTYVLVLMTVAFRYHLKLSMLNLDVIVLPGFGFYAFLVATLLSLVLGHSLTFLHRRATLGVQSRVQLSSSAQALHRHRFQIDSNPRNENNSIIFSKKFRIFFCVTAAVAAVFLSIGLFQKCFEFRVGGVAGMMIGDNSIHAYSLISLGTILSQSVDSQSQVGIRALQVAYFFFASVAPFFGLLFVTILFFCPMTLRRQLMLISFAEVANAWSSVEVFALSIVAALLEISTFASFILGDKCDLINKIIQDVQTSVNCYDVTASIRWEALFLVIGATLNATIVSIALRLAHVVLDERTGNAMPTSVTHFQSWKWTTWMFQSETRSQSQEPATEAENPTQMCERSESQSEWSRTAESNPEWKRWKETTSVT